MLLTLWRKTPRYPVTKQSALLSRQLTVNSPSSTSHAPPFVPQPTLASFLLGRFPYGANQPDDEWTAFHSDPVHPTVEDRNDHPPNTRSLSFFPDVKPLECLRNHKDMFLAINGAFKGEFAFSTSTHQFQETSSSPLPFLSYRRYPLTWICPWGHRFGEHTARGPLRVRRALEK